MRCARWESEFSSSEVDLSREVWRIEAPPADATDPPEPLYAMGVPVAGTAGERAATSPFLLETAGQVRSWSI